MVGTEPALHHRCVLATLGAMRHDFIIFPEHLFNASQLRVNTFRGYAQVPNFLRQTF
jgi:hypothetical protein